MWSIILDYLFPPRPTELIVREYYKLQKPLPKRCTLTNNITAFLSYQDVAAQAAIVENKYYHSERAAALLAEVLSSWLETLSSPVICIPIPLSKERQRKRTYNQVTNVLTYIQLPDVQYRTDILHRTRDTVPQTSLTKTERKKNMRDAFACDSHALSKLDTSYTVVLVDDVLTTGATMTAARTALEPHLPSGVTLRCVTLAH